MFVRRVRVLPWTLLLSMILLIVMGLGAIARGDEQSGGSLLFRQLIWVGMASAAFLMALGVPYRFWKPWGSILYLGTILLLAVVLFLPARHGSHRWISLGVINLQPSELSKLALIFMLAQHLMYARNHRRWKGILPPFFLTVLPVVLILREPDLGTALLFFPVFFAMLYAAGARVRHLLLMILLGMSCLPGLWHLMSAEQRSRVTALFRQTDGGEVPKGDGYHLHQSKQVTALGGLWGSFSTGETVDDPAAYHLPASRTDFIYSVIGERWGLPGSLAVLLLMLGILAQGLWIASATREPFGRLLAVGIVTLLGSQVVINTGMTVGLMPITGLTLPLVSYGGSSLISTATALGLLVNIALRPGYEISSHPFRFEGCAA